MDGFCSFLWPEEPVPEDHCNCQDCGLFEHGSRMIWGEGNPGAPIMVLLDNPGARENRSDEPFVCGTRQTLQKAAYEVGFTMNELYVTYILKRKPVKAYEKEITRTICMKHLEQQINEKQPQIIFCLGNVAVQSYFQDNDIDVKSSRGKKYEVNGTNVFTAYHPLAINRRPNLLTSFQEDWQHVANFWNESNINK